jgi:hypothetical protein
MEYVKWFMQIEIQFKKLFHKIISFFTANISQEKKS